MKVYNTHALTRNQRFNKAILYGVITALPLGIVFGLILRVVPITFDFMFVAVGYAIGYIIRTKGRGVQPRFSILAAVLCLIALILADTVALFGVIGIFNPMAYFVVLQRYLSFTGIWSMIGLLFRAFAIYTAYDQARIV